MAYIKEIWKDIIGFENRYQISNKGRVKALPRVTKTKNGYEMNFKMKFLKIHRIDNAGYRYFQISSMSKIVTKRIHVTMAESFLNHKRCGHTIEVIFKDNDKTNLNIHNLKLDTHRNNCARFIRGNSPYLGVRFTKDNLWLSKITCKSKYKWSGRFHNEESADIARKQKIKEFKL
tara:strand:+ start:1126 stop:1650 length:525 start_codon:yes stop_codon:yes gene_type:complete